MKLLVLLVVAVAAASAVRYDGYRVLQVSPLNDREKVKLVVDFADKDERLKQVILLTNNVRLSAPIDLAVSPQAFDHVSAFLDEHQFPFVVIGDDLQRSFDETLRKNEEAISKWRTSGSRAAPTAYLRYDEQVQWLNDAAAGSSIAETFSIGSTYEGRDMVGISINAGDSSLPAIWIDSNTHAREWIVSATTLYIVDQILSGTSNEANEMRTNYRWYILPNANPDGYEYCWTSDRMWRKTRSPNDGSNCVGTDPNRNWDENWGGPGASDNPCADDYHGPSAFSEVETLQTSQFLTTIQDFCNVMITIHSYGQMWLVPWGGYVAKPPDYDELMRVGNLAADAIQSVNGLRFDVGTPPDLLYVASGGSFDWTKAQANMAYSYAPELRPQTQVQGGFDIGPEHIEPSGEEVFAAVVSTAREATHKL